MFFHAPILIESNGYISPTKDNTDIKTIAYFAKHLTYISIFGYSIHQNGSLSHLDDTLLIQTAYQNSIKPLMVITNLSKGVFSSNLAHSVLSNATTRQLLIDNIITVATTKNYAGIHIDFENISPEDTSFLYRFIISLKKHIQKKGLTLSMLIDPTQHNYSFYQALDALDFIVIIGDIGGWAASPPSPIAPFNRLKMLLEYLQFSIPANKIMLLIPLYGYDWPIPFKPEDTRASCLSLLTINQRIEKQRFTVHMDYISQSPYFNYFDKQGFSHIVWFENEQSLLAKCNLIRELKLKGAGLWSLSMPLSLHDRLFENLFRAKK